MFSFKRDKNQIVLTVEPHIKGAETWEYMFRMDCTDIPAAQLLINAFTARREELLSKIRRDSYEQGWNDAKAKRRKETWFSSWW